MFKLKYLLCSLFSGLLLGYSWPTFGVTIFIFISLIPLFFLEKFIREDHSNYKMFRFFIYTFFSILTWNIITTWWLINASTFGMIFANVFNSFFYSLLFQIFFLLKKILKENARFIFFICLWICYEKLNLNWEFSWPWLNLGNVFSESIYWIQWYEYTGVFGGTLWVLIVNIILFKALKQHLENPDIKILTKRIIYPLILILLPIIFSISIYFRIDDPKKDINVIIIQPNIDPYEEKYSFTNIDFLNKLDELTKNRINSYTDYVITPETFFAEGSGIELKKYDNSDLHFSLQKFLKNYPNTQLISGIQFYNLYFSDSIPSPSANKIKKGLWVDYYNSAISEQLNKNFEIYNKSKLVVGVENLPYKNILRPLIGDYLIDLGGTVASRVTQDNRTNFFNEKIKTKAAPIICYEAVYGEFVIDYVKSGANFLSIITNDAWWGNTEGHKQLLSLSKLRAIENRRDIVRSANTGISAIINSKGEVISKLDYGIEGVIEGEVSSQEKLTFYSKYGDLIFRWSFLLIIILSLISINNLIKKSS